MTDSKADRRFSNHPYSAVPSDRDAHPARERRLPEAALGVLCAEAQADGVPCFELGRDCETCERAYRSWSTKGPLR